MTAARDQNGVCLRAKLRTGAVALGLLALLAALRPALAPASHWQPAGNDESARERANTSAFAAILGELRASAADLMWVKTERYLHDGVAFAPHVDAEQLARSGEIAHSENHDEEHGAEAPLIPTAEHDFRGFIGSLHRQVHPWQEPDAPHAHSPGDELLPWYRLLTLSNPRHWRGYMIGSWWLTRQEGGKALAEAAVFIDEGIQNNPGVFQLHLMRGRILMMTEDWTQAHESFERAVALGVEARTAALAATQSSWTDSDEEDFAAALRYVPLLRWRRLGDEAGARQALARALAILPGDLPLRQMAEELR